LRLRARLTTMITNTMITIIMITSIMIMSTRTITNSITIIMRKKRGNCFGNAWPNRINHAGDDFLSVGQFLVIGAFVAAICQTIIPREAFVAVAHAPGVAILVLMGLAVALNLCSGANAFVAASFRAAVAAVGPDGIHAAGPMLDTKLSAMYLSFISKRAFVTLLVLVYAFVSSTMMIWHYVGIWGGGAMELD